MPIGLGSRAPGSFRSTRDPVPPRSRLTRPTWTLDGDRATEPLSGLRSDTDDRKTLDRLEVPAVVRADLELVTQTGRSDQQVEVADRPSLLPEPSPLAAEDPADLIVDGENRHTGEELLQGDLAPDRVTRVVHALVQLGQRDDAHGQAGGRSSFSRAVTAATPLR